jgi:ankyrin repeat protein
MQLVTKNLKRLVDVVIGIGAAAFLLFMALPNKKHLNRELLRAVSENDVPWATTLLKQGARVDTKDNDPISDILFGTLNHGDVEGGYTVFMLACLNENVPLVKLLLQHRANLEMKNDTGATAFMWSSMGHNPQIVALLLDKGARVNVADSQGSTALMESAMRDDSAIVNLLNQHGVDVNAGDKQGHTALAWAIHDQYPRVVATLKQAGARQ